jgi:hypothetical protein
MSATIMPNNINNNENNEMKKINDNENEKYVKRKILMALLYVKIIKHHKQVMV